MNNYHVYEAIGRGKHSAVYKGRKKKTIEYYAIKSVDKSQRSKVLHEVRMLHALEHRNVLKFFSWYETSAHLWLILEYCIGGDLMSLLQQDTRLPESCIHDMAYDLVQALQYLHSKGIIYCDLKPSNILLDEYGSMKLCDFGLARRLSDIEKSSAAMLPQSKRGTPCYMAPELFQDDGVHSFASDFWALGCVLYECYAGRPPFVGKEFTQLVKSIISDSVPCLPGQPSSSFANLVNSLLVKDPAERLQWSELCEHSFWKTKFTLGPLPAQPAFNNMIDVSARPYLSERNGDRPAQQRTPQKRQESNASGSRKDENTPGSKIPDTPAKILQGSKKTNIKGSRKVDLSKGLNLLRMSRMAKLNLQRENEKENYRRTQNETCENDAEVKIENNDMELDFSENPDEDAPDDSDVSENSNFAPDENIASATTDENIDEMSKMQSDSPIELPVENRHDGFSKIEEDNCSEMLEVAATPNTSHRKAQRAKANSGVANDLESTNNISEVFWHSSDISVKPVVPGRKSEKALDALPSLPFEAVPASAYVKLPSEKLNTLNSRLIHLLNASSQISEKQNAIKYLEILSGNSDAARVITNGPVMMLLVKMLRLSKVSILRVQVASLIGLLIRHSSFIEPDLASSGIMSALVDALRDKQDKVRRFSMAALGELLFYISTQADQTAEDAKITESPSKDNHPISGWQVPNSVFALVSSILRKGEDDIAQLYALKTIDNICSQGANWTSRFASHDVVGNICYIYKAAGKQETTRIIAGSCLVRLARFSPSCVPFIFEKLSFRDSASILLKGTPREQQISLNLLIMAVCSILPNVNKQLMSLAEEKHLVPGLLSLVEQGTEALRGKALIFVALLCKSSRRWLVQFLGNVKFLSAIDRLGKEKDEYIQQCLKAFTQQVITIVPDILETVLADIQQLIGGKRHGAIATLTGRSSSKTSATLFPVILHLLGTSSFKHRAVGRSSLQLLANILKLLETHFQGRDDFQITLLRILELVAEESMVLHEEPSIFTRQILPSLATLYKGNKDGDARFLCLKIIFDVIMAIFDDTVLANDMETMKEVKSLAQMHYLPLYPAFIEDEDPIPMYAQKLLVMLIEFNHVKVSDILDVKAVTQCFEFLHGDLSNVNVSSVKLCLALASAPEIDTKVLSHLRVVRRIGNFLEFVKAKEMEDFLEPTLALCKAFILQGIGSNKAIILCKEPALLGNSAFDMSIAVDQYDCVKDVNDFASNVGAFLELSGHHDTQIMNLASECMILLLKAAPRETTMGILTNLPKIGDLMEVLNNHALPMLRLLYALAFSCRQYLSQAMILSIPVSAITRTEALLVALKSSSDSSISQAASNVVLELQRLPRV